MDLSLLSTPVSDYDKQRTGALFTIRSASSPSYSLSRRHGVRKPRDLLEEERDSTNEARKRETHGSYTGSNVPNKRNDTSANYYSRVTGEEDKTSGVNISTKLSQNRSADKTSADLGNDRNGNGNLASERHGRTDWIRRDMQSRSRSLDWRGENQRENLFSRIEGDISKHAEGRNERITGSQSVRGRVMSPVAAYSSSTFTSSGDQEKNQMSPVSLTLNRASRGNSLPSRMRSHSGSDPRGTTVMLGPKGGQSIMERIKKLYGSAGVDKTESCGRAAGGTFPRRFSTGEKSPVQNRKSSTWTQKDTSSSETSTSPGASKSTDGLSRGQWYGQSQGKISEEQGLYSPRSFEDLGTGSLDRARSRHTIASQIRGAQAAEGFSTPVQTNALVEEAGPKSWGDLFESSKGGERGGKEQKNVAKGGENTESIFKTHTAEKTELKSQSKDEDVFELNPQKITVKTTERKKFPDMLPVASSASVKNKINQFEALTQRSQSQVLPRRTFSVPTQPSRAHDGVKKSGSDKAISLSRDTWTGLKVGEKASVKTDEKSGKTVGSGRSLSVDEVGLRLYRKEQNGTDSAEKGEKEKDSGNNSDFYKYSRLKDRLEIPLSRGDQRHLGDFNIDETDFSEVLSPEETGKKPLYSTLSNSSDTSSGVHKATPLAVGDDDKTPTNTPTNSPFLSPAAEHSTPSKNESPSVLKQAAETQKGDSPPLHRPLTTSSLSDIASPIPPDANAAIPNIQKQSMLDMRAWVAGVNTKIKMWDDEDDEEDEEDDKDDDESTQKDEDSNYDSDSGESSVTITSNMSQSENKSFCVSLSDLCNFAGVDYESDNDSDEWQSTTRRTTSLSSDMSALSCVSVLPAEELDRLLEDVRSLGDSTLQDYNDVQVVVLHKEVGVGLGFSLAGGVDQCKPVTVHKVFPTGVAAQEGSIKEGDQVLSINGSSLCDCLHWEALRVLRRAKTRNLGVVVLRRGGTSSTPKGGEWKTNPGPTQTQYSKTGQQVCVRLEKNDRDLGFSLEGGVGSSLENRPLTVQKIFQGGPMDKVFPGDEVLEIDGVSVTGMRRLDAWSLIRSLPPGPVDVVLCRSVKPQET